MTSSCVCALFDATNVKKHTGAAAATLCPDAGDDRARHVDAHASRTDAHTRTHRLRAHFSVKASVTHRATASVRRRLGVIDVARAARCSRGD